MEIEGILEKLELSLYEKKVYLRLLQIGKSKSKKISNESDVSYGRIYEILEKLEKKGFVSSIPTIPKTFEAINPKTAIRLFLKKKSEDIQKIEQDLKMIEIPKVKQAFELEDKTIIVKGRQKHLSMLEEMKDNAKKEILVVPGRYQPPIGHRIHHKKLLKKGIKVKRILSKITNDNRHLLKENMTLGEEVRVNKLLGLRLTVVDRRYASIGIVDRNNNHMSIHTTNQDFANSMAVFFDSLWEKSKKVML